MGDGSQPASLVFDLTRSSPFSFKCQVCSACCHNKAIRIAPYEALRRALEKEKIGPAETEGGIPASEYGDSTFLLSSWLDIDATVEDYAKKKGLTRPESFEALVKLHLEAIEEWLTCLRISSRPVPGV